MEAETPASDVAWMSIIESWKIGYDMKAKRYVNIVSGNGRCILIYIYIIYIYSVCMLVVVVAVLSAYDYDCARIL